MNPRKNHQIVAEVSTTWPTGTRTESSNIIAPRFEAVIAHNNDRGYSLDSWQFQSAVTPDGQLVETIIAVFVKRLP